MAMSNIPAGKYAPKPRSTGNPSAPLLGPSTGAGRPRKPPTVALVAEHYLAAGVDHSLGHYARYWRDLFGEMALDELSPTWFRAWRREALERWAAATCRQAENALSGLFRVASEAGWKLTNPVRVCGLSQPRNCRYKALSDEESERLLAACNGDLRDVVAFALQTGLRIGELLSIEWEHLGKDGRLFVPAMKTAHSRTLPLTEAARAILEARRGLPGRPFPFSYDPVAERFKRAARRAGVAATLHSLRHYAAYRIMPSWCGGLACISVSIEFGGLTTRHNP
ncbi:hypothetical protein DYH09_13870, partial [bacterium CPR1]|nr:hypothetical protein [bacterium CPR1]